MCRPVFGGQPQAGAGRREYSPADVLATVGLRGPVDCTVVQGRIVVRDGRLVTVDEAAVAEEARRCCRAYLEKK